MKIITADISAIDVTKEWIALCDSRESSHLIDNLGTQKRLYLAQCIALTFYNKELFFEDFEAWIHGPVVASVYSTFKHDKSSLLDTSSRTRDFFVNFILDIVYHVTKGSSSWELRDLPHDEGGAWVEVYEKNKNHIIPKESIKNNFHVHKIVYDEIYRYLNDNIQIDEALILPTIKDLSFLS